MSGAEKFVIMLIAAGVRAGIEAAAAASANADMQRRETERMAEMAAFESRRRDELRERFSIVETRVGSGNLPLAAESQLRNEVASIDAALRTATTDPSSLDGRIVAMERRMRQLEEEAVQQAGMELRQRVEALRRRLAGQEQRLAALGNARGLAREREELQSCQANLSGLGNRLLMADETTRDYELRIAARQLDRLDHFLNEHEDGQRERKNRIAQELADYEARLRALSNDATMQRWLPGSIAELQVRAAALHERIATGAEPDMAAEVSALVEYEQEMIQRATAAQVKADQRDYIARGIRSTLQEMGFLVGENREEHAGHPATAISFSAVNDAGRGINVSVPVAGEIIYDIDGFPLATVSKVGGGTSATCDEAQGVLEEMHERLEVGFQVQSGELSWEGMDPDRTLRSADELPRSGTSDEERSR